MTVNEILEMFEELEYAAVQAVVSGCPLNRLNTAKEALKAAIEELHRDALRYKWLRATTNAFTNSSGERIDVKLNPADFDAAIDAAREST